MTPPPRFRTRVLRAVLLGLPGVAVLPFAMEPPPGVPALALVANPLVMLVLAALAGAWAAPRIGAVSALILGSRLEGRDLVRALAMGLGAGLAIAVVDEALAPAWRGQAALPPTLLEAVSPIQTLFGVLYGGLTEEVLMRWGLLSILAVGLLSLLPRPAALWVATILAAALFATAHLPALVAQGLDLTRPLLARMLGFNLLLGLAFGWAYLRQGIEAAIAMHAGFHLGIALLALAAVSTV